MASKFQMDILRQILKHWIINDSPLDIQDISYLQSESEFQKEMNLLEVSELIQINGGNVNITEEGKSKFQIVLTGGAYDLLHRGHLVTLYEAKSLGDFLVVVVAHDTTIMNKKRDPIHSAIDRAYLLNAIELVDAAVVGDEKDHMRVVRRVKPNIVAIGSDQNHIEEQLNSQIIDAGLVNTKIVRLQADYEDLATTKVIDNILDRFK